MWYSGNNGSNYRIIYCTSTDGTTWTGHTMVVNISAEGTYDTTHSYAPTVIKDGSTYKMWYTGNNGSNARIIFAGAFATNSQNLAHTFTYADPDSGAIADAISGAPGGRYYDEVNEADVQDLRMDANKALDWNRYLTRKALQADSGEMRGWELGKKFIYGTGTWSADAYTLSTTRVTLTSVTGVVADSGASTDTAVEGAGWIKGDNGTWYPLYFIDYSEGIFRITEQSGDVSGQFGTGNDYEFIQIQDATTQGA